MSDNHNQPFGELVLDSENGLIKIFYGPDSKIEDWKKSLGELLEVSEKTGIYRVLIDVRKQKKLADTLALFNFGSHLPTHLSFAVLIELHQEEHRFIENVAVNRGITVKGFTSEQEATDWLMQIPNRQTG